MKWVKKTLIGIAAAGTALYSGYVGYRVGVNKHLQDYVLQNSKGVLKSLEKLHGTKQIK